MTSLIVHDHPATGELPTALSKVARPVTGAHLATDLRTLAELAEQHPGIADLLTSALERVTVVIPRAASPDLLTDALIERGSVRVGGEQQPWWDTEGFDMPGGAVRILAVRMVPPSDDPAGVAVVVELNAAAS